MSVQFIFDWIPSYLLVISKVHKKPTPVNSPKRSKNTNKNVAQDEARPATEFEESKESKGEVTVRILTISMKDDEADATKSEIGNQP